MPDRKAKYLAVSAVIFQFCGVNHMRLMDRENRTPMPLSARQNEHSGLFLLQALRKRTGCRIQQRGGRNRGEGHGRGRDGQKTMVVRCDWLVRIFMQYYIPQRNRVVE